MFFYIENGSTSKISPHNKNFWRPRQISGMHIKPFFDDKESIGCHISMIVLNQVNYSQPALGAVYILRQICFLFCHKFEQFYELHFHLSYRMHSTALMVTISICQGLKRSSEVASLAKAHFLLGSGNKTYLITRPRNKAGSRAGSCSGKENIST